MIRSLKDVPNYPFPVRKLLLRGREAQRRKAEAGTGVDTLRGLRNFYLIVKTPKISLQHTNLTQCGCSNTGIHSQI